MVDVGRGGELCATFVSPSEVCILCPIIKHCAIARVELADFAAGVGGICALRMPAPRLKIATRDGDVQGRRASNE